MADDELKRKIEALLFSSGKRMAIDEIARACRAQPEQVKESLGELRDDYERSRSSLMLVDDGGSWKITVREKFAPIARKVVAQTELPKSVVETLSVVAWKAPVLQSDVIKVRTNKAYDHLKLLEDSGFITRKRYSRTQMINLTQKFFGYFDVSPDEVKAKFGKLRLKADVQEEKPAGLSLGPLAVYAEGDKPEAREAGEPVAVPHETASETSLAVIPSEPPTELAVADVPEEAGVSGQAEDSGEAEDEEDEVQEPEIMEPEPVITEDMPLKEQLAVLDKASKPKKAAGKKRADNASS